METKDRRTLVLADKRWLSARHMSPALFIFFILGVPIVVLTGVLVFLAPDAALESALVRLSHFDWSKVNWGKGVGALAMLGAALCQLIYFRWSEKRERLTLSSEGIRYTTPLPDSLKHLHPDWFLSWHEISRVELSAPKGHLANANVVSMTFYASSGKRRICPVMWVDPLTYLRPASRFSFRLSALPTYSRDEIVSEVMASAVLRYVTEHQPQIAIESRLEKMVSATSLEKDRHGRIAIAIIFGLMLYAFMDTLAGPESYIDAPSSLLHIYIVTGVLGALLSWAWLRRSLLPVAERAGLAFLVGLVVGVAMVPGALHINAYTDSATSSHHDYLVTFDAEGVVLRPVNDSLPSIDYFARHHYWDKYAKGDVYPVQVHRGIFGFYQFNSSVIIDDIHGLDR